MTIKQDFKQLVWYTFLMISVCVAIGVIEPAWRMASLIIASVTLGMFSYTGLGFIQIERMVQSALYQQEQGYVPLKDDDVDE